MRLIDADALFQEFENAKWYDNNDRDYVAEDILMDAPTVREWVPVTDRLPEDMDRYLVAIKTTAPDDLGGNTYRVRMMKWTGEWHYPKRIPKDVDAWITDTVTHWMPMPELPEVEE